MKTSAVLHTSLMPFSLYLANQRQHWQACLSQILNLSKWNWITTNARQRQIDQTSKRCLSCIAGISSTRQGQGGGILGGELVISLLVTSLTGDIATLSKRQPSLKPGWHTFYRYDDNVNESLTRQDEGWKTWQPYYGSYWSSFQSQFWACLDNYHYHVHHYHHRYDDQYDENQDDWGDRRHWGDLRLPGSRQGSSPQCWEQVG